MEFSNLQEFKASPAFIAQLNLYGISKKFKEGEVIIHENAHIKSIPIVISGTVKVLRTYSDGKELLLYYIKSGESCIMSLLGGLQQEKNKIKAIAEESTEILFVPIDKISLLIKTNQEWLDYIFKLYHKRFEELLEVVSEVTFKKMDERLLNYLKKKCNSNQSQTILITHEQLANELGTARVVVSRLLKQLEMASLVQLGRNKITLM